MPPRAALRRPNPCGSYPIRADNGIPARVRASGSIDQTCINHEISRPSSFNPPVSPLPGLAGIVEYDLEIAALRWSPDPGLRPVRALAINGGSRARPCASAGGMSRASAFTTVWPTRKPRSTGTGSSFPTCRTEFHTSRRHPSNPALRAPLSSSFATPEPTGITATPDSRSRAGLWLHRRRAAHRHRRTGRS